VKLEQSTSIAFGSLVEEVVGIYVVGAVGIVLGLEVSLTMRLLDGCKAVIVIVNLIGIIYKGVKLVENDLSGGEQFLPEIIVAAVDVISDFGAEGKLGELGGIFNEGFLSLREIEEGSHCFSLRVGWCKCFLKSSDKFVPSSISKRCSSYIVLLQLGLKPANNRSLTGGYN
jgi:hypothetical protein